MAISFVAGSSGWVDAGTSVSVAMPTGTQQNDVMLACIARPAAPDISSVPAGWTLIGTADVNGDNKQDIYYKVAAAGEAGPYVWGFASGSDAVAAVVTYRDVSTTAPIDAHGVQRTTVVNNSCTAPSVTTASDGCMIVGFFGVEADNRTWTPPSGMTERVEAPHITTVLWSTEVADVQQLTAGATGSKTASFNGTSVGVSKPGALVALALANVAPNAPTNLSPSGRTLDRSNTNRFSWDFSDPDAGDSQSQYDLRYRLTSSTAWTTVTGTTPNQFRDFPGGTFAAGDYEWQVRTYDAQGLVGPYSSSAFFTAADAPAGPSITDPVAGQTISTETYTVRWSTPSQEAFQVRTVADAAGSPDATTVYTDTGEVTSTTARSRTVSFAVNNRAEHVQVRVKDGGLWSSWISVNVTVSYTPPATPTVAVDDTSVSGAIAVRASHPVPSGSQPTVTSVDIYRRVTSEGGDGIRIAKDLAPTALYVDWAVASAVQYSYRVRAYGDNGTSSWSAWSETSTELAVVYGGGYE